MRRLAREQQGSAIATAILLLFILSVLMAIVGTGALSSMVSSRSKNDHSVGLASGDSGIEKIRSALQSHMVDESNGWQIDKPVLDSLVQNDPTATVLPNSATSDVWKMRPVRLTNPNAKFTVREEFDRTYGYWQVYDVIVPRFNLPVRSNIIYYVRAWATSKSASASMTTKPKVFRVAYRPTWFSDYQSVTDAPFIINGNPNVRIDAPIHSNGFSVQPYFEKDPLTSAPILGIWTNMALLPCGPQAKFTTSQGADIVLGGGTPASCTSKIGSKNAKPISLLGIEDSFRLLGTRCGTAIVTCISGTPPYTVTLGTGFLSVAGRGNFPYANDYDSQIKAMLFDGPVRLRGVAGGAGGKAARVTIATRRSSASAPNPDVTLDGSGAGGRVGASVAARDTVGILSQGDVILGIRPAMPTCLKDINLAAISESGAVTIPPEYVSVAHPPISDGYINTTLRCAVPLQMRGSFAAHGNFVPSLAWTNAITGLPSPPVGYDKPNLRYDATLYDNPPPFFPTADAWSVIDARSANDKCLLTPTGDPQCI